MTVPDWLQEAIASKYEEQGYRDYEGFVNWLRRVAADGTVSKDELENLQRQFCNPRPRQPPDWQEEEGVEAYLRNPPDSGPLAGISDRGWIDDETADRYRYPIPRMKDLLQIRDEDVISDIQENALHILGRCNNPGDWGENRTGLVYGMIQSGKTASMISLIALAREAGYRLFVVLAGDKSSLRDQTQDRINQAFRLENGINRELGIHSPTYKQDLRQAGGGYAANFRYYDRFTRNEDWTTIIVIKKNPFHLRELIGQIEALKGHMRGGDREFGSEYPTLIVDDEADYASQNTDVWGTGSTIHGHIVNLRKTIPWNTYVGYTATPQACLSADVNDPVGYPKDFFWLLEPYMDEKDGLYRPRTYLGAWEVFWQYDHWLVHSIPRDQWPHYEKDSKGRSLGIYVPPADSDQVGRHDSEVRRTDIEEAFLEDALAGRRPDVASLTDALLDFMIGCGVRWSREWQRKGGGEHPSRAMIEHEYGHHAAMIHLSETQANQERVRELVQRQWKRAVELRKAFDPASSPPDDPFRKRLRLQQERTKELTDNPTPRFEEIKYFIDQCIEIAERPINDHRHQKPYPPYPSKPFVYLLNSSDDGMELFYDRNRDPEIKTKKAAIVVGGFILSRGLTIEGLCVSVFGRTSQMPLGDAMLQMGRWFGHKASTIDLISVFVQDDVRNVLAQVAEADRYLRLQIKDAIVHGNKPTEVLLEMTNSPLFRITSPSKSEYLRNHAGVGFAGNTAQLNQPSFDVEDILKNKEVLDDFQERHAGNEVHKRAFLYEDVPPATVVELLRSFACPDEASQAPFGLYADYLKDWMQGEREDLPPLPRINVAVMNRVSKRRRITVASHPTTADEARRTVADRFGPIIGGQSHDGYRGDAFLDKPEEWHLANPSPSRTRPSGDEILIVFYKLDPNYVTKNLYDPGRNGGDGGRRTETVRLRPGDPYHVGLDGFTDDDLAVITYAAWTPIGGPMYKVMTNSLIDVSQIRQVGRQQMEARAPDASE